MAGSATVKASTVRFDKRMLENMQFIKEDTLRRDGVKLSNNDALRKALELTRQRLESV